MTAIPMTKLQDAQDDISGLKQSVANMQESINQMQADIAYLAELTQTNTECLRVMSEYIKQNHKEALETKVILQQILDHVKGW